VVLALVSLLGGLAIMVAADMSHRRDQHRAVDELLGMTPVSTDGNGSGDDHVVSGEVLEVITGRAVHLAARVVDRVDRRRVLGQTLEQARIPLRPGEFVIVLTGGALAVAALVMALTHSVLLAAAGAVGAGMVAGQALKRRVTKRRKAFGAQLPDALSLVASSLSAGHTFLRAVQMMCEECQPPLSEEFALVVAESSLGDPVVDALDRMAARVQIRDMDMVVQAMRIQQTVGGRLAELLHTLAETTRAREEVRREVQVLTAEGRISAYVLAGLVPFLFVMMEVLNPVYVKPLHHGWGLYLLIGCGTSVAVGLMVILRMVKIKI